MALNISLAPNSGQFISMPSANQSISMPSANQSNSNISLRAAGEPHFVGFDGVQFDYHGVKNNNYLIYADSYIKVVAKFMEPDLTVFPIFAGKNYMSKIIVNNDYRITFDSIDNKNVTKEEVIQATGCARGLDEKLQFIEGEVTKMDVIDFANGKLIVTLMEIVRPNGILKHFNLQFDLLEMPKEATGILGQTLLPKQMRKSNNSFMLPTKI